MQACCFTGHRRIEHRHLGKIDDLVMRAVAFAYEAGCRRFYVGGAIGFDTVAAKQVILFRISHPDVSLVLFLPCLDQDSGWSMSQKDAYEYILSNADEVKYISENYDKTCMKRRNQSMAEECDIMIAYVSRDYSGSAQTMRMAVSLGKEVYNLYPNLEKGSI